jgi:hypothetical protein
MIIENKMSEITEIYRDLISGYRIEILLASSDKFKGC